MTVTFRQSKVLTESSAVDSVVTLDNAPLNGSALIAIAGCLSNNAASRIVQQGAAWALLYEGSGGEIADKANGSDVRIQLWGAFDVNGAGTELTLMFSGGTTKRGIIVAEYIGDVFLFPNPADRVKTNTGFSGGLGAANTGAGGITREDNELWVAGAIGDQVITWSSAIGYTVREQSNILGDGDIVLIDKVVTASDTFRAIVNHTAPILPGMKWAIVGAALRGQLQVPFDYPDAPTPGEPVTENTDHEGDAIGHLLEQFKSHDKR